ncbi:hypothetical protein [Ornithinimicrobium tianjinense]|uniref:Uncharacterized protein n=1 Tax=Ornithinimicrobium tianjinense TaxID=1195761 RepID=A0A917BVE1_9MICO|nr:hypothetical protein [Ornithinimicrobium tianjinense]GGF58260.1 hypothetical protein GCM10011366_27560 [Ornithinimicrobium tianjinense]
MVAPIENRSVLSGVVRARRPSTEVERWELLEVEVEGAEGMPPADREEGLPNLLSDTVGQRLEVAVDRDLLPEGDLTGWVFTGPVRVVGPGRVAALPAAAGHGGPDLTPPVELGGPH